MIQTGKGTSMVYLREYRILSKNGNYYIISKENHTCPICHGPLRPRDIKRRKSIDADGEIRIYYIRRLKCRDCGTMHIELPDIFLPHKHYSRSAIESALSDPDSACPAENSTIQRWSKELDPNPQDSLLIE